MSLSIVIRSESRIGTQLIMLAARAPAAEQCHPCHIGFDLGNLDPVVAVHRRLHDARDIRPAMLAVARRNIATPPSAFANADTSLAISIFLLSSFLSTAGEALYSSDMLSLMLPE
jgi:hypothetical protein